MTIEDYYYMCSCVYKGEGRVHQVENRATEARFYVVGQNERGERKEGDISEENTMETRSVCPRARAFTRGKG